jgi:hypothetical protein
MAKTVFKNEELQIDQEMGICIYVTDLRLNVTLKIKVEELGLLVSDTGAKGVLTPFVTGPKRRIPAFYLTPDGF